MKRKLVTIILAVMVAFAFPIAMTGCNKDGKTIKINEVTHSVFYAPLYLADALGYFKNEGYQIELTNGGGADKTMAAVLAGEADVGFCGPEAVVYTYIGGSDDAPRVFGQLTKRDGSFLVGRKAEPNFSWNDLQGKNIIAGRPGGVPFMTFEYVLKNANVTANLVKNIDFNLTAAAFKNGTGDYCTMFEPTASDFVKEGNGYIVASVGEKSGEIPYTCFMAKQSYIDKNGDKVRALLRAMTKAIKYIDENSVDTVANLIKPYFEATSVESIKTSLESYISIDAWVKNMAMEESSYERLLDVIDMAGELEKRVDFHSVVLTETADNVYREIYA